MAETTPLDLAHSDMIAAPEEDAARLSYYERLAEAELFLLLETESDGETLSPRIFDLKEGRFVLVFDREARLADFAGAAVPHAAISGRSLAAMLAGQGIGLGVNLDVASSAMLLPASAVDWMADLLSQSADEVEDRITRIHPPRDIPEKLLSALDAKLALAGGMASRAYLVSVSHEGGAVRPMLAIIDARQGAEPALTQAVNEALAFSGVDGDDLDLGFFQSGDPITAGLARNGLRFDLPKPPETPGQATQKAPGMDPEKPPILR